MLRQRLLRVTPRHAAIIAGATADAIRCRLMLLLMPATRLPPYASITLRYFAIFATMPLPADASALPSPCCLIAATCLRCCLPRLPMLPLMRRHAAIFAASTRRYDANIAAGTDMRRCCLIITAMNTFYIYARLRCALRKMQRVVC